MDLPGAILRQERSTGKNDVPLRSGVRAPEVRVATPSPTRTASSAAIPSVSRSVKDPLASNEANVTGTVKVLVAAKDCGVPAVVAASSSSVYSDTPVLSG